MARGPRGWDETQLDLYKTGIGRLLFDLWNVEGEAGRRMLKEMGYPVTPAHVNIVPHIGIEGTRLTDIAQRAHLTKQSVWESLKSMEAHGYIARSKDPRDGRAVLISWTPKGIDFLRVVCLGVMIREGDLARRLGKKDAQILKRLLTKLRDSYVTQRLPMAQLVAALKAKRKK